MNKTNHRSKYTPEIIEFIRNNVKDYTDKQIAVLINEKWALGINEESVTNAKSRYGIRTGFGRGYFVKGHVSSNPIKKGEHKSRGTEFKKGVFSHNRVPIGSERLSKDGYLEVKIQDGHQVKNWKSKHRIIWEQINGPIPPKHRIVFLDGNKSNLDITNLELMTYAQTAVMSKKSLFYKDPELTKLGSKIAEIELKVNERKRKVSNVTKY